MKALIVALALAGIATPALAQHQGHSMPMPMPKAEPVKKKTPPKAKQSPPKKAKAVAAKPKPKPKPKAKASPKSKATAPAPAPPVDHSTMDHSTMDPSAPAEAPVEAPVDHSTMDHSAHQPAGEAPIPQAPPPPEAGSGPPRAADAIWGAEAMAASRGLLAREHGDLTNFWLQGDRIEARAGRGGDGYLWDVQGYYGGDIDKFWFKSEGEGAFGRKPEEAEVQGLWSHAITPWFDLQAGVRHEFAGPDRTQAVIGVQGIAPYFFEIDAAAFLSTKGELTARIEGELDQRITQRLILQPRAELALSAQNIRELGVGAGIDHLSLGLRLRYEFTREFAPYVGVEQEWKVGKSAEFARAEGDKASSTRLVVGVRFWL